MQYKKLKVISASCFFAAGLLLFNPLAQAEQQSEIAQPNLPTKGDVAQAQYPLDKAIENSKLIFDIDSSYDVFKSGYNTYDGKGRWDLNWSRSEPNGHISVQVHGVTGEIVSFDRWEELPAGEKLSGLPKYDYQAATALAQQWAQKLAPNYYLQTKLIEQEEQHIYSYNDRGPIEYYYNFVRVVNGVTYPENSITVRINADTGQLLSFYANWDVQANFPPNQNIIDAEQAENILNEQVELAYQQLTGKANETPQVMLVYRLKGGNAPLIDAHTGKLINEQRYRTFAEDGMGGNIKEASKSNFTEAEQHEIENLKNILSADEALKRAKSLVKIPNNLKLQETNLQKSNLFQQRIWSFYFRGDGQSMNVAVDATSGDLVYLYNWSNDPAQKTKVKYNKEQAQGIAEEFIKKLQPQQFAEVSLANSMTDYFYDEYKELPTTYNFLYERMVNDIPFSNNGFRVEVNAYTGEISYYNYLWWQPEFPEPTGVMKKDQAAEAFLQDEGLNLEYYRLWENDLKREIKLVYNLKNRPSLTLDAFTGDYIDWNGKPIPPKQTTQFTDITGHPTEEAITKLAQAKIARSSDGKFFPDRNITKMEALTWLVASKNYYILERTDEDLDKNIINEALRMGLIEKGETETLHKELTRLDYAKLMINYLDYDGAAKLSDIYVLKTKDAGQVPQGLRGYAAITLALGLQTEMNGNYNPNEKIPRGYAAISMLRLLNVEK